MWAYLIVKLLLERTMIYCVHCRQQGEFKMEDQTWLKQYRYVIRKLRSFVDHVSCCEASFCTNLYPGHIYYNSRHNIYCEHPLPYLEKSSPARASLHWIQKGMQTEICIWQLVGGRYYIEGCVEDYARCMTQSKLLQHHLTNCQTPRCANCMHVWFRISI